MNSNNYRAILVSILATWLSLSTTNSNAGNKVVVIPVFGETTPNIENVITVAKSGGDFTNPIEAVNSITDATANKPYTIFVAPGVYSISKPVVLSPYISLTGSGQNTTVIRNINPANQEVLGFTHGGSLANSETIEVSNIKLQNSSGGQVCYGVNSFEGYFGHLDHVTIEVTGCSGTNAAIISSSGGVTLDHVTIKARGGQFARGISANIASGFTVSNSKITVSGGSTESTALRGLDGPISIYNSTLRVQRFSPSGNLYGIKIDSENIHPGNTDFSLINSEVIVTDPSTGMDSIGVYVIRGGNFMSRSSLISAGTASLYSDSTSTVTISNSSLIGSTVAGTGNVGIKRCAATDDGSANLLDNNCGVAP